MHLATTTKRIYPKHGWEIVGLPLRRCFIAILSSCAIVALIDVLWLGWFGPDKHYDFYGIWSFSRFMQRYPIVEIYNADQLQAFQHAIAPGFTGFYPCPYPPSFLVSITWLGRFSTGAAKVLWTAVGLLLMAGSCWIFFQPPMRKWALLATVLAPASLLNGAVGETGFFSTSFLIAGFAWLPKRPVLAGVAFGLLTLKPQLGVLVPFALLARGEWRAIIYAAFTALTLIGVSCLVLPLDLWTTWIYTLPQYQRLVLENQPELCHLMATIDSALLCLHAPASVALAVQVFGSSIIIVTVWCCFRMATYRLAVAALLAGTALASPHAFAYDTSFLICALFLAGEWIAERKSHISTLTLALCLILYLLPLGLTSESGVFFIYAVPETLIFFSIARLALTSSESVAHNS